MKTYFLTLFSIISLFVFSPLSYSQEKLKIGFAGPLTGQYGWLGTNIQNGMLFYLKYHPDFAKRIELKVEDTFSEKASSGLSAVNKLVEQDKVDVFIICHSGVLNAAAPIIERLGIPTIGIQGDDSARNKKYMVKLYLPLESYAKAVVEELEKHKNVRSLAIITSEYDSMLGRTRVLKERLKGAYNIVFDENSSDPQNLPAMALRLVKKNPDLVVINLMPGQVSLFTKRLRIYRYHGLIIGPDSIAEKSELDMAEGSLAGALYVDPALTQDFLDQYQKDFGEYPPNRLPNGYDAMKILDHALKTIGDKIDRDKLNTAIRVKNFDGALGHYSFSEDGSNCYDLPAVVKVIPLQ